MRLIPYNTFLSVSWANIGLSAITQLMVNVVLTLMAFAIYKNRYNQALIKGFISFIPSILMFAVSLLCIDNAWHFSNSNFYFLGLGLFLGSIVDSKDAIKKIKLSN